MKFIVELSKKLSNLKKSSEFVEAVGSMEGELSALEASADDLKEAYEAALFESPEKVSTLDQQIQENREKQARLRRAVELSKVRLVEIRKAEELAEVESRLIEARKAQAKLKGDYIQLHEHLTAVSELLSDIRRGEDVLRGANELAARHGLAKSSVRSPWWHLGQLIGHAGHVEEYPLTGTLIRGYFPSRHPDGPALQRMKEVKLPAQ